MDGCLNLDDIVSVEEIELDTVYDIAVEDNTNYYLSNKGSSILVHNSGKTYSTCQYLLYLCTINTSLVITIARDNLVVSRRTVYLDFLEILDKSKIRYTHTKSNMTFKINGNLVRFVGLDDIHKVHGLKQDICYINEGLNISMNVYNQLLQRTSGHMIIDYNPSSMKHFLYDWGDKREDCTLFRSNVFGNPLVPIESLKQILSYKPTKKNIQQGTANEYYWNVYGLGHRFRGSDVVIRQYWRYDKPLEPSEVDWMYYGGDFGFVTDPTTLVEVSKIKGSNKLYCRVHLYKTGLTNKEIADEIKQNPLVDKETLMIFDSAEPKSIRELAEHGLSVIPARKGPDSIHFGIQKLNQYDLYIYKDSLSDKMAYECENLRYVTDGDGEILKNTKGYPIIKKGGDQTIDPIRYVISKIGV